MLTGYNNRPQNTFRSQSPQILAKTSKISDLNRFGTNNDG